VKVLSAQKRRQAAALQIVRCACGNANVGAPTYFRYVTIKVPNPLFLRMYGNDWT